MRTQAIKGVSIHGCFVFHRVTWKGTNSCVSGRRCLRDISLKCRVISKKKIQKDYLVVRCIYRFKCNVLALRLILAVKGMESVVI
jgi:hypothetical protein